MRSYPAHIERIGKAFSDGRRCLAGSRDLLQHRQVRNLKGFDDTTPYAELHGRLINRGVASAVAT